MKKKPPGATPIKKGLVLGPGVRAPPALAENRGASDLGRSPNNNVVESRARGRPTERLVVSAGGDGDRRMPETTTVNLSTNNILVILREYYGIDNSMVPNRNWERGVSCNPATRRSRLEDGLRSGVLVLSGLC
ncbi:hypothetical protein ACJJTC_003665 [Scirpophaga incertulas]